MFSAKMGKETDKTGYDFHSGYLRSRSMYAVIARSSRFFSFFRFWRFSDKPKFVTALDFPPHYFAVLDVDGGGQAKSRRVIVAHPATKRARCETVEPARLGRKRN